MTPTNFFIAHLPEIVTYSHHVAGKLKIFTFYVLERSTLGFLKINIKLNGTIQFSLPCVQKEDQTRLLEIKYQTY